ncbi:helix-turn-helix transcriptional regulator [Tomitella biformata]|uniref:helix-turn-helix transcriptional regulator n=1 Tax=Tomitella biformata TaxID=630403 RepID=UPI0004674BC0|nr:WYL domain-containing protein [Tomitella biformata]
MTVNRAERLVNLVICLLASRQFVPASKIRATVTGYQDSKSDGAFSRMFERDKNDLRDLGIPLETSKPSWTSEVEGYRISPDAYELPEIDFTPAESAAVAVAAQLWESPEFTTSTQSALLKLRAAGIQVDGEDALTSIYSGGTGSRGSEPALAGMLTAVESGRVVTFSHRASGRGAAQVRRLEPWAVVTHSGRWYVVGHDRDREATRTFRLSRIVGPVTSTGRAGAVKVPAGVDPRAIVAEAAAVAPSVNALATVWVAAGRVHELRRIGAVKVELDMGGRPGSILEVPVDSWEQATRTIASYGVDAIALAPSRLRAAVLDRLEPTTTIATEERP